MNFTEHSSSVCIMFKYVVGYKHTVRVHNGQTVCMYIDIPYTSRADRLSVHNVWWRSRSGKITRSHGVRRTRAIFDKLSLRDDLENVKVSAFLPQGNLFMRNFCTIQLHDPWTLLEGPGQKASGFFMV